MTIYDLLTQDPLAMSQSYLPLGALRGAGHVQQEPAPRPTDNTLPGARETQHAKGRP